MSKGINKQKSRIAGLGGSSSESSEDESSGAQNNYALFQTPATQHKPRQLQKNNSDSNDESDEVDNNDFSPMDIVGKRNQK